MANNLKLNAVKYVREVSGLGLADAKAWVENYKSVDLHHPQIIGNSTASTSSTNSNSTGDNTIKPNGGCYIATCVYGSYDCPQVWTLRRYRDDTLGATWYGRLFIRVYYAISPTLVKWFGKTKWFKKIWQGRLDKIVAKLNAAGVEDTPYQDKEW